MRFFPDRSVSDDEFRKRQVIDLVKVLGYSEDRIKQVEDALAKYENVDDALEEIKKLELRSYKEERKPVENKAGHEESMNSKVKIIQGEKQLIGSLSKG